MVANGQHPEGFGMRARNILLVIAAGLASAALAYFGTGLHPLWWALWLAPVPVLAVAPRLRRSVAFLLASLAWLIGELNQLAYFRHGIELSLPVIIILLVIPAAVFGLGILFARAFLRQGLLLLAALAFAATWVTYRIPQRNWFAPQHIRESRLQPDGLSPPHPDRVCHRRFGNQLSRVSFCRRRGRSFQWARKLVAAPHSRHCCRRYPWRRISFGEWRLRANPPAQSVAITLLAKDVPMSLYLGSEDEGLHLLHEYADEVRRATAPGTEVVVILKKSLALVRRRLWK